MSDLRVFLVDDNPAVLRSLVTALGMLDGVEVVGSAGSGREALNSVRALPLDLVLMDVHMPVLNGIQAVPLLLQSPESFRVVLMSDTDAPAYERAALESGAVGFLAKSDLTSQLPALIERLGLAAPKAGAV